MSSEKPKRSERICFRGDPITSIEEVVAAWLRGEWFVVHVLTWVPPSTAEETPFDKSMHPEMILNMKARTILELITAGKLFRGVTRDGEPFKSPACSRPRRRHSRGSLPLRPIMPANQPARTVLTFEGEKYELHPSTGAAR